MYNYQLQAKSIQCPYCWEMIDILIDCSIENQQYIEDCQVCCRPINFTVIISSGSPQVNVATDDE